MSGRADAPVARDALGADAAGAPNMLSWPERLSCWLCWPISTAPSRIWRSCERFAFIELNAPHLTRASIVARVIWRRSTRSVKS